jgi:isoleucyl-tRNA synthetase
VDLSAFYFDVRKDSLYCDRPDSVTRRSVRTVLDHLFSCLTAWLAPVLCFTTEEAWLSRYGADGPVPSVHLRTFVDIPQGWASPELAAKWDVVRDVRRVVTGALELERSAKRIGSSLQASPVVTVTPEVHAIMAGVDLAEVAITSDIRVIEGPVPEGAFTLEDVAGVGVVSAMAEGEKCERCWKVLPEVGGDPEHPTVCNRCADAVDHMAEAVE